MLALSFGSLAADRLRDRADAKDTKGKNEDGRG